MRDELHLEWVGGTTSRVSVSETLVFGRRWGKEEGRKEEKRQDVVMGMHGDRRLPCPTAGKVLPPGTAAVELAMKRALQALVQRPSSRSWRKEALSKRPGGESQVCVEDLIEVGGIQRVCVLSLHATESYQDLFPVVDNMMCSKASGKAEHLGDL